MSYSTCKRNRGNARRNMSGKTTCTFSHGEITCPRLVAWGTTVRGALYAAGMPHGGALLGCIYSPWAVSYRGVNKCPRHCTKQISHGGYHPLPSNTESASNPKSGTAGYATGRLVGYTMGVFVPHVLLHAPSRGSHDIPYGWG